MTSAIKHLLCSFFILLISCGESRQNTDLVPESNNIIDSKTAKITGVGGVFFKSKNPTELKQWYQNNLGIITDEYGYMFKSRDINNPSKVNYLQWSPFHEETTYFTPSNKEFMINYTVQNIENLVTDLQNKGVIILDSIEEYEYEGVNYGKFIHILDLEGNKIELWEPPLKADSINWNSE